VLYVFFRSDRPSGFDFSSLKYSQISEKKQYDNISVRRFCFNSKEDYTIYLFGKKIDIQDELRFIPVACI
jgi:hypothetical protein